MIVMVASDGDSARVVYNHLTKTYGPIAVLLEDKPSRKAFIRNRIRKLGFFAVASQLAFMIGLLPFVRRWSSGRIEEIVAEKGLDLTPIPETSLIRVENINSAAAIAQIGKLNPVVVVVNGTRILSREFLNSLKCRIINTHMGITPAYRGVHGGYWSLYQNDRDHCGVTVHLVDPGVDTGDVVAQARIEPTLRDSFVTYPYLQIAAALPKLTEAVDAGLKGSIPTIPSAGPSRQWYHPGAIQYLLALFRGVK